jgi:hypothetical protein
VHQNSVMSFAGGSPQAVSWISHFTLVLVEVVKTRVSDMVYHGVCSFFFF